MSFSAMEYINTDVDNLDDRIGDVEDFKDYMVEIVDYRVNERKVEYIVANLRNGDKEYIHAEYLD